MIIVVVLAASDFLQAAQPMPTDAQGRPLYQDAVVVVKIRGDAVQVDTKALPFGFGIPSLDAVSNELGAYRVERLIATRSDKALPGLPDLTKIYRVALPALPAGGVRATVAIRRDGALLHRSLLLVP